MVDAELTAVRIRWWRRALELQAVSAKEGSAPLGMTSTRHLEMALEGRLGPNSTAWAREMRATEKLLREFPQFFKLQEERFKFRVCPLSERQNAMMAMCVATMIQSTAGLDTKSVPWRPIVDQTAKEQAALFTTACAGPSQIQLSSPSYAHRLVTSAGASTGVCIDGEDVVAILCAVHAFREVRDVNVAARRLNDPAECREVSAPASDPRREDRRHRWVPNSLRRDRLESFAHLTKVSYRAWHTLDPRAIQHGSTSVECTTRTWKRCVSFFSPRGGPSKGPSPLDIIINGPVVRALAQS